MVTNLKGRENKLNIMKINYPYERKKMYQGSIKYSVINENKYIKIQLR